MNRIKLKDRILPTYTKGEEIFNMTSHIVRRSNWNSRNSFVRRHGSSSQKCLWNYKWGNFWSYNDNSIHYV